jgi:AcrR family transcriptional regulator
VSVPATRSYGGLSGEERQAERRARLVAAGLELLGREGWESTTVRAVCQRARLTPRYFYESFPNLDTLVVAIFDEIVDEAAARVLDAYASAPEDLRAKSRATIAAFVELLTDDPRKGRVAFVEAFGNEALMRRRFETVRFFAQLVAQSARTFSGRPETADPVIDLAALLLIGGMTETLITWLNGALDISREQLIDDCADLFVATGQAAISLAGARTSL